MRIDFNVLWIDDQPDRVDAQITAIKNRMREEGFLLNATTCRTMDGVKSAIADHVFTDEVDLILVDWDLGSEVYGQYAIAEIRRNVPYKDVVFYSARTSPRELQKLAFEAELEGIYCASRLDLVEEVVGVFESLVKKVLDLDHARGIVMGATSDIDHIVIQCLKVIYQRSEEGERIKLMTAIMGHVNRRATETAKKAAALANGPTLEATLAEYDLFSSNDRLRILAGLLQTPLLAAHSQYRNTVTAYQQQVVPGRNILAHKVRAGRPAAVVDGNGDVITVDRVRELRRSILDLRQGFRDLLTDLQSPVPTSRC